MLQVFQKISQAEKLVFLGMLLIIGFAMAFLRILPILMGRQMASTDAATSTALMILGILLIATSMICGFITVRRHS